MKKAKRKKAKVEGCGRIEASALPVPLSGFALRRKPHSMAVMRHPD